MAGLTGIQMKNAAINLLFPRRCPVCGEIVVPERNLICPECVKKLSPVKEPTCRRCGKEVYGDPEEYCADCLRHKRSFESGAALLNYNDAARKSVAAVKYRNRREYLDFYAAAMDLRFRKLVASWRADVLVPIPIHSSRRRERGYNQAEELAGRLGKRWGIPVDRRLLVRSRRTAPQRELNPAERLANLQAAFAVHLARSEADVPKRVILIDDIYTTGSTMEACTRVLKQAGVEKVHFLVICIGGGRQ
ncbi:MAG: ComF family protein [Clostridiales bacterium]|nr:ComF family protein [Clostridiales bacterium]